jgi:hypothetical protein
MANSGEDKRIKIKVILKNVEENSIKIKLDGFDI